MRYMAFLTNDRLSLFRRAGALLIAGAAVIIWVTMGSSEKSAADYQQDIHSAMIGDRVNQRAAETAPQQAVVNGWTARDLLKISAGIQAANTRDDDRIGAELMLLIVAVSWWMLTNPRQGGSLRPGESPGGPTTTSIDAPARGDHSAPTSEVESAASVHG